jgi:hypothetical protein
MRTPGFFPEGGPLRRQPDGSLWPGVYARSGDGRRGRAPHYQVLVPVGAPDGCSVPIERIEQVDKKPACHGTTLPRDGAAFAEIAARYEGAVVTPRAKVVRPLRTCVSLDEEALLLSRDAAARAVGTDEAPEIEPRLLLGEPLRRARHGAGHVVRTMESGAPEQHQRPGPTLQREARDAEVRAAGGWRCVRRRCGAWNRKHWKMCHGCGKRHKPSATMIKQAVAETNTRLEGQWRIIKGD